jgi:hypothetical protein
LGSAVPFGTVSVIRNLPRTSYGATFSRPGKRRDSPLTVVTRAMRQPIFRERQVVIRNLARLVKMAGVMRTSH